MNRATVFTISFLLLLSLGESGLQGSEPQAVITVYTQFDDRHSDLSFGEMKKELAAIMGPIGLDFAWRSLPGTGGGEVAAELVVVSFKGKCEMEEAYGGSRQVGALGWTHMSDGEILPFTDVDCDRIRRFIYPQMAGAGEDDRERVFGRALGRVLAHELYHIFTKTTRHASWGVAKAFYTAQELVSDTFVFESKESTALREGKVKSLLRHSPHHGFTGQ